MQADNELLLFEKYTAFQHDSWDRQEWLALNNYSAEVHNKHIQDQLNYGYSFVQDAYYALKGATPNDSLLGALWKNVLGDSNFKMLPPLVKDLPTAATVTMELAEKVQARYQNFITNNKDALNDQKLPGVSLPQKPSLDGLDEKCEGLIKIDACLWALFEGKPTEKRADIEQVHDLFDIKNFAKILGWAQMTIGSEAKKGASTAGELTGYKNGGWSANVHPRDMYQLAKGNKQAQIAMAENQLTVRQFSTLEPQGRGGVIVLRDVTGSMADPDISGDTTRNKTAVSLEIALALAFNKQNRDLVSIAWSTAVDKQYTYGEKGWKDYISIYPRGSTVIDRGLARAIKTADAYAPNSDMLIITDGFLDTHGAKQDNSHFETMLKGFRERGGKVWAIILADSQTMAKIETCWNWVDGYITTESLADTAKMTNIIGSMARPRGNEKQRRLV